MSGVNNNSRIKVKINEMEREIKISQLEKLIENFDDVYIQTPNGFDKCLEYKGLGIITTYYCDIENGSYLICDENTILETTYGKMSVKQLFLSEIRELSIFCDDGYYYRVSVSLSNTEISLCHIVVQNLENMMYVNSIKIYL